MNKHLLVSMVAIQIQHHYNKKPTRVDGRKEEEKEEGGNEFRLTEHS